MKPSQKIEIAFEDSPKILIQAVTLQRRTCPALAEKKRWFWARLLT